MPEEEKQQNQPKADAKNSKMKNALPWIIISVAVLVASAGGFALAQIFAAPKPGPKPEDQPQKSFQEFVTQENGQGKSWHYEIEPVVANLDEPGVTRYARVTISLVLSEEMDQETGSIFLDEKTPIIRDWLTTYVAGLSLERVRGTSNLSRIKKEIRDNINTMLFPQAKPYVTKVLFKEFAIQ